MKSAKLTRPLSAATSRDMRQRGYVGIYAPVIGLAALAGCININAPNEAIVIELNINIRQEVIYRLAADVEDNIEANPDIF